MISFGFVFENVLNLFWLSSFQAIIRMTRCVRTALKARILMRTHRTESVRNGQSKYRNSHHRTPKNMPKKSSKYSLKFCFGCKPLFELRFE